MYGVSTSAPMSPFAPVQLPEPLPAWTLTTTDHSAAILSALATLAEQVKGLRAEVKALRKPSKKRRAKR